jgi:hypothetical protein
MAGFSLSADELERVCHRMRVHSDRVLDSLDSAGQVGTGEVGPMDFGGARHADLARRYGEVLDDVIPRMLREFSSATTAISTRLEQTLAAYLAADEERARTLR